MTDRSIPHLRDIFGFHGNWSNNNQTRHHQNEVEVVDQMKGMRLESKKDKTDRISANCGNDSAISSIGSASEEEIPKSTSNKKKKQRSRRENSKTLTEKDVKHLERHLSMKKTIRKKIMRDLQQAFVEDPNEFRVEDREQLKAEINIQSLSFGNGNLKSGGRKTAPDPSFLDMLRGGSTNVASNVPGGKNVNDDGDSGRGSPTRDPSSGRLSDDEEEEEEHKDIRKSSFWSRFTIKGRNKR